MIPRLSVCSRKCLCSTSAESNKRDSDKHARDPGDLFTGKDRKYDRERMQMNTLADDARVDHVILRNTQHRQKYDRQRSLHSGLKTGDDRCDDGQGKRSDDRHELEYPRQNTQQQCIVISQKIKPDRTDNADPKTRDNCARVYAVSVSLMSDKKQVHLDRHSPTGNIRKSPSLKNWASFKKKNERIGISISHGR